MPRTANAATARTNITLRMLLPGLHFRGHQTDLIDAGAVSDIDRLGDPLEIYGRVAFDENDALGACLENFLKTSTQPCLIGSLAIDRQIVIGINCDYHRALIRLVRFLVRR